MSFNSTDFESVFILFYLGTNISMGIVIRFDAGTDNLATPSRGMIYYGNTGDNQHFYVRKNFGGTNTVSMGQDTNGTDVWTAISGTYTSSDGFNVFLPTPLPPYFLSSLLKSNFNWVDLGVPTR